MSRYKTIIFSFIAFFFMALQVNAKLSEKLECLAATRQIEAEYNIPRHILSAIALTESGRIDKNTKLHIPWPWTANIGGAGRYFKSKHEALFAFKQLIARRYERFDVGCMQINWRYHKNAFSSIEEALEPYYNVRYAAEFLTALYKETGSWTQAAVYYHSKTPVHYQRYRKIVALNWDKARDLMSPINGRLNEQLNGVSLTPLMSDNTNMATNVAQPQQKQPSKLELLKINRMRKMVKLLARIRQYAQSSHIVE